MKRRWFPMRVFELKLLEDQAQSSHPSPSPLFLPLASSTPFTILASAFVTTLSFRLAESSLNMLSPGPTAAAPELLGTRSGAMCKPCGIKALGSSLLSLRFDVVVEGLVVEVFVDALVCRSTWPKTRVGSTMLRTSCLRCFTSGRIGLGLWLEVNRVMQPWDSKWENWRHARTHARRK